MQTHWIIRYTKKAVEVKGFDFHIFLTHLSGHMRKERRKKEKLKEEEEEDLFTIERTTQAKKRHNRGPLKACRLKLNDSKRIEKRVKY